MVFTKRLLSFLAGIVVVAVVLSALANALAKSAVDNNSLRNWNEYECADAAYAGTVEDSKSKDVPKIPAVTPAPSALPSTPEINQKKPEFPVYVPEYGVNIENAQRIYEELTTTWELGSAAAYGVLANIYCESRFVPTAKNGDSCYGICQWTASRYDSYIYWCNAKILNPHSLDTQISYLGMELTNAYYDSVYAKLKECEDTADGLYNAAYIFCKRYEIPYDTENQSLYRADLAVQMFGENFG